MVNVKFLKQAKNSIDLNYLGAKIQSKYFQFFNFCAKLKFENYFFYVLFWEFFHSKLLTDGRTDFLSTYALFFPYTTGLSLKTEKKLLKLWEDSDTPFFRCENDSLGGAIWRLWPKRIQSTCAPNIFSKLERKSPKKRWVWNKICRIVYVRVG